MTNVQRVITQTVGSLVNFCIILMYYVNSVNTFLFVLLIL